jgi:hypothetical protein
VLPSPSLPTLTSLLLYFLSFYTQGNGASISLSGCVHWSALTDLIALFSLPSSQFSIRPPFLFHCAYLLSGESHTSESATARY